MLRFALLSLTLVSSGCATASEAAPERPLTRWAFVAIDGQPPLSAAAELAFFENRIQVTVGCNMMSGKLEATPGQLKIGPLAATRKHCDRLMDQERAVAELLEASPGFFAEGDRMGIRSDRHIAELVRKRVD